MTTRTPGPVRVLVADDHVLFRRGLHELLDERGIDTVGEARDGDEAVRLALTLHPDVVLMDLNMPKRSGVEATRELAIAAPELRTIVLTVSAAEGDLVDALLAGACGYLLKDASVDMIVEGVRAAAAGESCISPAVASRLIARVRADASRGPPLSTAVELSPREVDVLRLMSCGHDNPAIAAELHISNNTVKNHVSSILRKLGVSNRIEAAVYAVRHRLV